MVLSETSKADLQERIKAGCDTIYVQVNLVQYIDLDLILRQASKARIAALQAKMGGAGLPKDSMPQVTPGSRVLVGLVIRGFE